MVVICCKNGNGSSYLGNTMFRGVNIHLPAVLVFQQKGIGVLTHSHIWFTSQKPYMVMYCNCGFRWLAN